MHSSPPVLSVGDISQPIYAPDLGSNRHNNETTPYAIDVPSVELDGHNPGPLASRSLAELGSQPLHERAISQGQDHTCNAEIPSSPGVDSGKHAVRQPPSLLPQTREALTEELREVEAEEMRLLELVRLSQRKRELHSLLDSTQAPL